jgi:hypothetical protein
MAESPVFAAIAGRPSDQSWVGSATIWSANADVHELLFGCARAVLEPSRKVEALTATDARPARRPERLGRRDSEVERALDQAGGLAARGAGRSQVEAVQEAQSIVNAMQGGSMTAFSRSLPR